jgi:hypothetical protein
MTAPAENAPAAADLPMAVGPRKRPLTRSLVQWRLRVESTHPLTVNPKFAVAKLRTAGKEPGAASRRAIPERRLAEMLALTIGGGLGPEADAA